MKRLFNFIILLLNLDNIPNFNNKFGQFSSDLQELGLTWNVKTINANDTEVEIQVARLPKGQQHDTEEPVDDRRNAGEQLDRRSNESANSW